MAETLNILKKQEELLQFTHFDHNTAYKLGTFMVDYAQKNSITIAVSIRMNNGCILFQHCPDGTNLLNQKWMVDLSLFHLQIYIVQCLHTRESLGNIFHFQKYFSQ